MRRLGPNVAASMAMAAVLIGIAFLSVPLILGEVGLVGYGIWTLGQTLLLYVTTAEAGLGPAVQRFVAAARGDGVARLLWSSLALYLVLGTLLGAVAALLAPALVDLLDAPARLQADAEDLYRLVGLVVLVALLGAGLGNVMQGLERFVAFAVSGAAGALVYLASLALLLGEHGLLAIGYSALAQQTTMVVVRAVALRDVLTERPRFVTRGEARPVLAFAARLQVTVLSLLVNTQTDKLVVGAVTTPATLGQLGIGSQLAESGRLVGGAALSPIISRLTAVHAAEEELEPLFARLNRLWTHAVCGATVIGAAALYPFIEAWLGEGHGEAAGLGAILVVAFGISLLTGPGIAYLRAVGRPSLEARYGLLLVGLNLTLTVALGIAFGAYGVVAATALTYALGQAWFWSRLRQAAPALADLPLAPSPGPLALAAVAGAAAAGWGLAMNAVLPAGIALAPVALGIAAAFAAFALKAGLRR